MQTCLDALLRLVRNVLASPAEPKFRSIRLANPRIQAAVAAVPGAIEFLECAGFQLCFPEQSGGGGDAAQPTGTEELG